VDGRVAPSRDDPALRSGSEVLGGPTGRHMAAYSGWWTPLRVLLALATVVMALGVVERTDCRQHAWSRDDGQQFAHACYSDIPHMYRERGFAEGAIPYIDTGDWQRLEYPVLTGGVMWATAEFTSLIKSGTPDARAVRYYDVNAVVLGLAGLAMVAATMLLAGRRRPWDAALVAASPVLALHGTINWDLIAVALSTVALLAWARKCPVWCGVLLGLAVAAKLYPMFLLLPIALLCARSRRWLPLLLTTFMAGLTWLVVNAPLMIGAPEGWREFYKFNADRGADFGSVWYVLDQKGHGVGSLNIVSTALMVAAFAGIAVLAFLAPRPPRLMQLAFLTVAAFLLFNKVWSPQYALWLLPLAVLARPRVRDIAIWQAGEVIYYFAVWYYLLGGFDRGLPLDAYAVTIGLRVVCLLWLVGVVIRDILRPECDPVRADGVEDDPAAGYTAMAAPGRRRRAEVLA
jgi:uncharacterized membrane protein